MRLSVVVVALGAFPIEGDMERRSIEHMSGEQNWVKRASLLCRITAKPGHRACMWSILCWIQKGCVSVILDNKISKSHMQACICFHVVSQTTLRHMIYATVPEMMFYPVQASGSGSSRW